MQLINTNLKNKKYLYYHIDTPLVGSTWEGIEDREMVLSLKR
jgi:hypothetical protein